VLFLPIAGRQVISGQIYVWLETEDMENILTLNEMISELSGLKPVLTERFGITKIAVFGSYVNGNPTEDSDIDILIMEMTRKNGFTIASAARFLSEHFQKKVDLGLYDSLRLFIKQQIKDKIIYV
jgi:predicted nucleotidyltransferase